MLPQKNNLVKSLILSDTRLAVKYFWISAFTILTAIAAQIEIPLQPVPFTMQTFFVLLAGALLGKKNGAISMLLYLGIGAIGLPVFSLGQAGIYKLLGPTGGYLLAFPIAAYAVGFLTDLSKNYFQFVLSVFVGSVIIFLFGIIHLNIFYIHDWTNSLYSGFLIFSIWDGLKIMAVSSIAYSLNHKN